MTSPSAITIQSSNLPTLDSTVIGERQPVKSYKLPFPITRDVKWQVSTDGGKTKSCTGLSVLGGTIYDLQLVISPAAWKEGAYDYRLRLMFLDRENELVELHLNAINTSKRDPGALVIPSASRSLLGALYHAGETDKLLDTLRRGIRLELKAGQANNAFIELSGVTDVNGKPTWLKLSSPQWTNMIPQGVPSLVRMVEEIKDDLRKGGMLQETPAIVGQVPEEFLPVTSEELVEIAPAPGGFAAAGLASADPDDEVNEI